MLLQCSSVFYAVPRHSSLANWFTKILVMLVKFELYLAKYSEVADFQD